ncbi:MAG: tetratricopeptide repeat protein, partial [Actinomycetota bacterium]|nr:tetratricopeptide repeat protein [Actinomycetota bacterium]
MLTDTIVESLGQKHALVVLDNCEHLLEGCAQLAERLLRDCASLSILATSRQPLGVSGECVRHITPLDVPPAATDPPSEPLVAHDAVRLFVERAMATRSGFGLDAANAPVVAEICRRLDGIPLAIELAAARLEMLSPQDVLAYLDERFPFLTGAPAGHQKTLFAALESSHRLLTPGEAALSRRLSVFVGGFTLGAAEAVCSGDEIPAEAVIDLLAQLVSKSLVSADTRRAETRFRLLETIRAYAARRLEDAGEKDDVSARHCRWCIELAECGDVELAVDTDPDWLRKLGAEQDNFRAALRWALLADAADAALRLTGALVLFWWLEGHIREGRQWLERALTTSGDAPARLRARVLWGVAFLTGFAGDVAQAIPLAEESVRAAVECQDASLLLRARLLLGLLSLFRCPKDSVPLLRENLALARKDGPVRLSSALATFGTAKMLLGEIDDARRAWKECLELSRANGNRSGIQGSLCTLGQLALAEGDYEAADSLLHQSLALAKQLLESEEALVLSWLGELARERGQYDQARSLLEEALALEPLAGPTFTVARCLCFLGRVDLATGDSPTARARFTESLSMSSQFGLTYLTARCLLGLGEMAMLEGDEPAAAERFDQALAVAQPNGDRQAVAAAWHALADLARVQGPVERAHSLCVRAMRLQREIGDRAGLARSLETAAALLRPANAAVRLFAAAHALRDRGDYGREPAVAEAYHADLARCRQDLDAEAFAKAWNEGLELTVREAVTYAGRGSRHRPSNGWASLTPAEHDVARLAAQGFTNREIGERLFRSPRTAGAHLTQVFAKLGIRSRKELE